ncbi:glycosyltransferase family 2 protein [uncultured Psychroserpens sp.]|uniref:glycosyltransferase family 2 protein n=1 Tax=uncultured Psychroserpens sp. TaxID=255436 RepID=UPI0026121D5F|nr:glycosyltransferase family 2 protein [uncultured Psychroserpens sp.]
MANSPLVSIIIPTYNREQYIGATLDSVVQQTYKNWECIVIDDGSTDHTGNLVNQYIRKDPRVTYYQRPTNRVKGGNAARNYGFELSNGKYIIFLDSDDLLLPNTIQDRVNLLDNDVDMLINLSAVFFDCIGDSDLLWNTIDPESTNEELLIRFFNIDMPWQTNGVTWSKAFFQSCGNWNEDLNAWQDWEMHSRAILNQPQIKCDTSQPDNYYRHMTKDGIASAYKSDTYLKSIELAIRSIARTMRFKNENQAIALAFERLIYRKLIEYPVLNGKKFYPLKMIIKNDLFFSRSRLKFLKLYLIILLGRSTKIKKYVLHKTLDKITKELQIPSSHLKESFNYKNGN